MSHIAKIDIEIKDLVALNEACKNLGLTFKQGQRQYKWFGEFVGDSPMPEGMTKEDDSFSARLKEPPVDGPGKGKSLAPPYEKIRDTYYREMGWGEDGMPNRETLESLGLGFTLSESGEWGR